MVKNYTMKEWTIKEITNESDLSNVQHLINEGYDICGADTETTGLHIILDKAFCITIALANYELKKGKAYIIDLRKRNKQFISKLEDILLSTKVLTFWNTKFDLHMLYNVGLTKLINHKNLTDSMIYARLAADAITTDKGGVDLRLKPYSKKYLDSNATDYEKEISAYKKNILLERNKLIKEEGFKIQSLNEFLKDKINSLEHLPKKLQNILKDPKYDPNNYTNIPWDILKKYAIFDAIFAVENYLRDKKQVLKREQDRVAKREEKLIPILWQMERHGFKLNKLYLNIAKTELRKYIIQRRTELEHMTNEKIKIGQHELIKKTFKDQFGIELSSADEDSLSKIKGGKAEDIAQTIIELRTLEKWYSTYIIKWEEYSDRCDRIYTSFKQCGAVSGRFSCDFQQFPKEPLYKRDGTLLFSPRRIVMISGGDYDQLCLIDYAAEELRIQALYTMLINKPDLNLCRAYIPMNCEEIDGKFYLKEDITKKWVPTDLHTLTTLTAFPDLKVDDPEFKHYRKIGKCTNFACNYNASKNTLIQQFGYPEDMADKLYNAYHKAYPGINDYREWIKNTLRFQDYMTNLFGRRYYNCSWHNMGNYLVQGSGADLLKIKLIELNDYIKNNNLKSRILCTIHDEIMFEIHKDEHNVVHEFKKIMEDVPASPIPFVGEIEVSYSTWDAKKELQ